jgi:catechol 2,3-dioxygenase-like lactoylglutathione lyase family enzyme
MKLHHMNIKAPRELLEREKEFFCDVLNLQEGDRPNFSCNGYWLYADGNAIVHLTESETHFENERQGFFDHVAFQTSNLNRFIETLKDREIEYTTVYLPEIEMTQVFLTSPLKSWDRN